MRRGAGRSGTGEEGSGEERWGGRAKSASCTHLFCRSFVRLLSFLSAPSSKGPASPFSLWFT